ncbi:MAG: phosphatase PAP2 family protein [Treponema sp.]|jgi:membrane-associated phospholipid phosphatase|nr:phosphatase PAP2 family protein [Treponema sp.]
METVLQWGLDFIRFVQSFASPALTAFMRAITMLGAAPLYIILLPFVYWCVNEKKGVHLNLIVLISIWINISLKFLLDQPRPFFEAYDPSVGMLSERMGGFPSGHAQNSLVMFIIIASWGKRKWYYGIAALACFLIGFSRIYLGVHFPTDVLGGWIIGAVLLCIYFLYADRMEALLAKGGFRAGMIASAALAFVMILYRPGEESLMSGGTVLGMGVGYCLNRRYIGFESSGLLGRTGAAKYITLSARFILGIAGVMLIFAVWGRLVPQNLFSANQKLFGFIRFTVSGLWISAGAPWVFRCIHLAEKNNAGD